MLNTSESILAQRKEADRQKRLQFADDMYQSSVKRENIRNLELQNAALSSSISAMGGILPGQSSPISVPAQLSGPTWAEQMARFPIPRPIVQAAPAPSRVDTGGGYAWGGGFPSLAGGGDVGGGGAGGGGAGGGDAGGGGAGGGDAGGGGFPSLAEIQGLISSSQQKAEEDFDSKINLLQNQERQKQEEEQTSARNAASRTLSYQQRAAAGAWESALRGR